MPTGNETNHVWNGGTVQGGLAIARSDAAAAYLAAGSDGSLLVNGSTILDNASLFKTVVKASGDTSGVTDSAAIQAAINALRGIGGVVGLKGHLYLSSGLTLYPGIGLVGEGPLSQGTDSVGLITAVAALNGPVITMTVDPTNSSWVSFPWVANLAIGGATTAALQDGIFVTDANGQLLDYYLDHVLIFDVGGNGLNQASANCKGWVNACYFERCRGGAGVRTSKGSLQVKSSYIQNNTGFGVDATSSTMIGLHENYIWSNAGGGVQLWSLTGGASVRGNLLTDNGDNTHPVIVVKSNGAIVYRVLIDGNQMIDTRASGSACSFFVQQTLGGVTSVVNNTMTGQKSGNDAISRSAFAGDSMLIRNNVGFNGTKGQITNPFDVTRNQLGIAGTTSTAVASTDYTVNDVDQYIVSTAGTGVSISIKDAAGNTIRSALTTLNELVPVGFKLNFGGFSVAPTVTSFPV